jgi:7,8-dihydroneopterin aldolase/epimerase/oxygenase
VSDEDRDGVSDDGTGQRGQEAGVDRISVTGIEVFAHHGVLAHERELGQRFVVDLVLELDLSAASASDALSETIDYGRLTGDVAEIVAGEPADLLEVVAGRVAERCLQDPKVAAVEVTVHKPAAPVPVLVADVAVTLRRTRP